MSQRSHFEPNKHYKLGDRNRVAHHAPEDTQHLVVQSQKDECDINKIMEKYRNGGELQHINKAMAQFGDFSSAIDFSQALTSVAKAEAAFAALPAYARDMMGNDPEAFLYKMENPEFAKRFVALGLLDPEAGPVESEPKSVTVLEHKPAPTKKELDPQADS